MRIISIFLLLLGAILLSVSPLLWRTLLFGLEIPQCVQTSKTYIQTVLDRQDSKSAYDAMVSEVNTCKTLFFVWDEMITSYSAFLPGIDGVVDQMLVAKTGLGRDDLRSIIIQSSKLIDFVPELTGIGGERRYLVLLQNDTELRPTGGFIGSFLFVRFIDGRLEEIKAEDIYAPDGQLVGYVEPPAPIKTYLYQTGGWKLRDSNWSPDFPTAVQTMLWFFEKGGYTEIDGVIAVTLSSVEEILKGVGPLYLPDENVEVSADSLWALAQSKTEEDFFPGSTNKRDILGSLTRAFLRSIQDLDANELKHMTTIILKNLTGKQILAWFQHEDLQALIVQRNWGGAVFEDTCSYAQCRSDEMYIVESNLGINKANCCIDRQALYEIWLNEDGSATSSLTLRYTNHNPSTPQPPKYFGGGYNNYLRIFRNKEVQQLHAFKDGLALSKQTFQIEQLSPLSLTAQGFLADVGGGLSHTFQFQYQHETRLRMGEEQTYRLTFLKQPGLHTNDITVRFIAPQGYAVEAEEKTNAQKPHLFEKYFPLITDTTMVFTVRPF
jgi:hypothetical protein